MPICENCGMTENETLQITLPKSMKGKTRIRNFRNREKASLCFNCIRTYARYSLDFYGYWHKFIFPQQHRSNSKGRSRYKRGRPKKS